MRPPGLPVAAHHSWEQSSVSPPAPQPPCRGSGQPQFVPAWPSCFPPPGDRFPAGDFPGHRRDLCCVFLPSACSCTPSTPNLPCKHFGAALYRRGPLPSPRMPQALSHPSTPLLDPGLSMSQGTSGWQQRGADAPVPAGWAGVSLFPAQGQALEHPRGARVAI